DFLKDKPDITKENDNEKKETKNEEEANDTPSLSKQWKQQKRKDQVKQEIQEFRNIIMECQMRLSQHCVQHQLSLCYNENKKEKDKEKKLKKEFPLNKYELKDMALAMNMDIFEEGNNITIGSKNGEISQFIVLFIWDLNSSNELTECQISMSIGDSLTYTQVIDIANILVSSELKQQIQFVNICDQLLNLFPPAYGSEHLYSFIANLLKECCIMMNKNDEPAQFQLNPNINGPGIQMYFDFAGLFPTQLLPNTNIILDKNGNTMMYWFRLASPVLVSQNTID
ncbi:hypothetical protein RFI_29353, partial [Reticulomyxa filosa]